VVQKLIRRKELKPKLSEPSNRSRELSAVTTTSLLAVNRLRNAKKRCVEGSPAMYEPLYTCTQLDTTSTGRSIPTLRSTKSRDQVAVRPSVVNQLLSNTVTGDRQRASS
jgi:hypothetical protein